MKLKKVSDALHQKVLGWTPQEIPASAVYKMQQVWADHGLQDVKDPTEVVEIPYPDNLGRYREVMDAAVALQGDPWLDRLDRLAALPVPPAPALQGYRFTPGWHRVAIGGATWETCECPQDTTMILDFETGWLPEDREVWYPAVCGCLSDTYWYVWVTNFDSPETTLEFTSGNLIAGHNCVPLDTLALTKDGWKVITDVKAGDLVLGYEDGKQTWTEVLGYVDGGVQEVIELSNAHRSYKATKGHRWLAHTANGHRVYPGTYEYMTTSDLEVAPRRKTRILNTAESDIKESVWTPDEAALIAWIWADGSLEASMGARGQWLVNATITQKMQFGQEAIEALLERLRVRLSHHPVKGCNSRRYYVPSDVIRELYDRAELRFDDPDQYVKLVCRLSTEALTSWLDTFVLAEGTVSSFASNAIQLSQCPVANPGKHDAILAAAQILGYNPSVSGKQITLSKRTHTTLRRVKFKTLGVMPVGCLRTKTSNWVMRQGNEVTLTGNCQYDRQYLRTEYLRRDSGNRFFDTMAAWIATRGFTNQQRGLVKLDQGEGLDGWTKNAMPWLDDTTTAGLDAIHEFYCGRGLDKGVRDAIVEYGLRFIQENLEVTIAYCLQDVQATLRVFQHLYPEWCNLQPSKVSRTAQLMLGNTWLPMSAERFPGYYDRAEKVAVATAEDAAIVVERQVDDILGQHLEECQRILLALKGTPRAEQKARLAELTETFRAGLADPQLALLDWTPALSGKRKGLPQWYRDMLARGAKRVAEGKATRVSLGWREVPLLLGMTWRDEPILWGALPELPLEDGSVQYGYYTEAGGALPHPEDREKALTGLFIKGLVSAVDDGILGSKDGSVKALMATWMSLVNWTSLKKRVKAIHTESPEGFPVVLPQILVTGTVTRRCTDRLWQVASNPKKNRIGTELKSMVEAPPGYRIVGADADSQELWIAACFADSALGYCGSSPLGLSVLIGDKDKGTDMHTLQAKAVGIKRDYAKNLVYGCVPLDTEALTKDGWKPYRELRVGDEILAYDQDERTTKWAPIQHLTFHEEAETIRVFNKTNYSHVSTPDHRWVVDRRTRSNGSSGWVQDTLTTATLTPDCNIIAAATNVETDSLLTPDEASVLGWILSDGYFEWSPCVSGRTSQARGAKRGVSAHISQKKQPQCDIILDLLKSEGAYSNTYRHQNGCDVYAIKPAYLRSLWDKAGLLPGKEDYVKVVTRLSTAARKAFLEAFYLAEGYKRGNTFVISQNEGNKLDAVVTTATLLGYRVSYNFHSVTMAGNNHYKLLLQPTQHVTAQRLQREYLGTQPVWCPTTMYGTWVMRQGHTISITGNCVYGLGIRGAASQLMKNLPDKTPAECEGYARSFLNAFKGQKSQHSGRYVGGLAADAFNTMAAMADTSRGRAPTTPVLKARISHALRCKDFQTTRTNWCIQSSGSDWRDLWVVLMGYLFDRYQVDGRLLMTIHDEARFLVREDQTNLVAYLLQIAHLMIRAAFIEALGLDCIPASVAWHSGIDVDTVLRKDPSDPQITPSQPTAIAPGYTLKPKDVARYAAAYLSVH